MKNQSDGSTFKDRSALTYEPINYIVDSILPPGLTMVYGDPKCGKSWFVLNLILAINYGKSFLGYSVPEAGDTLYLTLEDSVNRLSGRILSINDNNEPNEHFFFGVELEPLKLGGLSKIKGWLAEHKSAKLVVIDTLERVRTIDMRAQEYHADYAEMSPIAKVAKQYNVCIVVVHHSNKSRSDIVASVSGSNALAAGLDTMYRLSRDGDEYRRLEITGRDVEVDELLLEFKDHLFTNLGNYKMVSKQRDASDLLNIFTNEHPVRKLNEIADHLGVPVNNALRIKVCRLVKSGILKNLGYGLYGRGNLDAQ